MKTKMIIKTEKGATLVEFAIILPLLLLFLFGIIEFSLLLYNEQVITNAAREGARAGLVVGLDRTPESPARGEHEIESEIVATTYCSNHLITFGDNANPLTIAATSTGPSFGDDLSVTVTYLYDFLVLSNFGLSPATLESVSTMKLE